MARPTKYTPETVDALLAGIRKGLTTKDAALLAGITDDTVANWQRRYSDFSDRLARAHAERAQTWLGAIAAIGAQTKDWRAIAELLDRCAPEYRKTAGVDVKHSGTVSHNHRDLSAFTDEQIAKLAAVAEEVRAGGRTP